MRAGIMGMAMGQEQTIETRLETLEHELSEIKALTNLLINYMQEVASEMKIREKTRYLDEAISKIRHGEDPVEVSMSIPTVPPPVESEE